MSVYTLGIWTVRQGEEEAFVGAWMDLARRTKKDHPQATAVLLRDQDRPQRFISFGPWESVEAVRAWRASDTFTRSVGAIRGHLESFEPHTMDVVQIVD